MKRILVVGSGAREHALVWRLTRDGAEVHAAPGNAGIADLAECVALDVADHAAVLAFIAERAIDFVVIGPEAPLVGGLSDALAAAGIKHFGPSKAAARRLQGLHQGPLPRGRHSDRRLRPLQGCGVGEGLSRG